MNLVSGRFSMHFGVYVITSINKNKDESED